MIKQSITILSLHWGFSLGGVGKYATLIESVGNYAPVQIKSVCILGHDWQTDQSNLDQLDVEKIYIKSRLDPSWISKISSLIKQYDPDLIMTHGFNGHFVALLGRIVSRKKTPVVCSYHGVYHATTFTRRLFGCIFNSLTEVFLGRVAVGAVCVADFSKRCLCNKGVNSNKLTVIYNGIEEKEPDTSKRIALRNDWGINDNEILFGVASRFDPVKGLEFLIESMALIERSIPHAKLIMIGTGDLAQQLKTQVKLLGLESKVLFTGFRTDIDQCLGAFDVFMLPSLSENHSIAILEAMRAGKPIVATDVGGNTESIRHMKQAIIVPARSAASLAEAMQILAEDEALGQKLGKNARARFLEEFTVDIMVKKTAEWLVNCGEKLIDNKDKPQ